MVRLAMVGVIRGWGGYSASVAQGAVPKVGRIHNLY